MKRFSLALVFVTAGLIAGIVLTGRMRSEDVVGRAAGARDRATARRAAARARRPSPRAGPGLHARRRSRPSTPSPTSPRSRSCGSARRRSSTIRSSSSSSAIPTRCSARAIATRRASAPGVIVSADGYVVTNNHVLGEGRIDEVTVSLADKRELRGHRSSASTRGPISRCSRSTRPICRSFRGAIRRG